MNCSASIRQKRHLSYVTTYSDRVCYRDRDYEDIQEDSCQFLRKTPSCNYYQTTFNAMELLVCVLGFDTSWIATIVTSLIGIIYTFYHYIFEAVLVSEFIYPNYITMSKWVPVTPYVFGYLFGGLVLLLPEILDVALTCNPSVEVLATLKFIERIGLIAPLYCTGFVVFALQHKIRLKAHIFWWNFLVILLGYKYTTTTTQRKMANYYDEELPNPHEFSAVYRSASILAFYLVYCLVVGLGSYAKTKRLQSEIMSERSTASFLSEIVVEDDPNAEISELTSFQLFLYTINPYEHLKSYHKFIKIIIAPVFVFTAAMVPVIDTQRHLDGWCKITTCVGLIMFPFIFLAYERSAPKYVTLTVLGVFCAILVILFTRGRTAPTWKNSFAVFGFVFGSMFLAISINEAKNMIWQVMNFYYGWPAYHTAVTFLPLVEVFCIAVLLIKMLKHNHVHLASGTHMGAVTMCIYLLLPKMMISVCPVRVFFGFSASSATACFFFYVILISSALFLSAYGFVVRPVVGFYIITIFGVYIVYQLCTGLDYVHPVGTFHKLHPLNENAVGWA